MKLNINYLTPRVDFGLTIAVFTPTMSGRLSYPIVLGVLLSTLGWWAQAIQSPQERPQDSGLKSSASSLSSDQTLRQRELVETLDHLVAYEHYYRSVYGHFTKLLNRIGCQIPKRVMKNYEIRVAEASSEKLVITAFSEIDGKTADLISIDQEFEVHANFALPLPRPEHLRARAIKHLRLLREAPAFQTVEEQGVYRNYFKFEVRTDSKDRKVAFAVGIRPPVRGVQIESVGMDLSEAKRVGESRPPQISDLTEDMVVKDTVKVPAASPEEANLAQRIFYGEMGRYAKSASELARIAYFEGEESSQSIEFEPSSPEKPALGAGAKRNVSSVESDLEIEPIRSDKISRKGL